MSDHQNPQDTSMGSESALKRDYLHDPLGDALPKATSRAPLIVVACLLGIVGLIVGFNSAKAWTDRIQLNVSLRDTLIFQYELDKAIKLFDELDAVINAAILKAGKREYDPKHVVFLTSKVNENPVKAQFLSERSYKSFGRQAVARLAAYYVKWSALYQMLSTHRQKTLADEAALKSCKAGFQKIATTSYGAAFKKDDGKLVADIVYLGKIVEKKGKQLYPAKAAPDSEEELRELYNPPEEGDEGALADGPEKYVVEIAPEAKSGLLSGAVTARFSEYMNRLYEISVKMKAMRDEQTGLARRIAELASQDPAALASPDPEAEFEAYVTQSQSASGTSGSSPEAKAP